MNENISSVRKLVNFWTANFAAASAVGFLFWLVGAALLTSSYLSVFNPGLIWIVEYTDLIKVGLAAIVFLLGFFWIANNFLGMFLSLFDENESKRFRIAIASLLILALLLGFGISIYQLRDEGVDKISERVVQLIVSIAVLFTIVRIHAWNREGWPNLITLISDASAAVIAISLVGVMFGYYVKNSPKLKQTVYLDDGVLYDASVVLVTAKFAVLYSHGEVMTFPADRIRMIRGKRSDPNP